MSAMLWFALLSFHAAPAADLPPYTAPKDGDVDERGRVFVAARGGWFTREHLAAIGEDVPVRARRFEVDDESDAQAAAWAAHELLRKAWVDGGYSGTKPQAPKVVLSWDELAAANDADTMADIAAIKLGELTVLGQCSEIRRVQ